MISWLRTPEFLHAHKSSWHLPHASRETLDEIRRLFSAAGLYVTLIYSSGRDLDAVPGTTDKGRALQWLCERISLPLKHVVVAGDTANDGSLFALPEVRGIVVSNAEPALFESFAGRPVYAAERAFASGVLQGLAYFNVI